MPALHPTHLASVLAVVDYNSKTYDLVLLAHVLSAVVGMVAVVVSARESGVPIDGGAVGDGEPVDPAALCLRSGLLGIGLGVVLVAVAVLMVAKP